MITLKNGGSELLINEHGAEMKSFKVDGTEYLWTGDPDVWASSAPICFPMTGGLKYDKYTLDGVEYTLPKHGFAKNMDFEVESQTENTAVFLLKADDDTRKVFPYEFELRIKYVLTDKKVTATYLVTNLTDKKMWFSIGSHDGFACPEGIEDYDVIFSQNETLKSYTLFGNLLGNDSVDIIENSDTLPLDYNYFAIDALVFKNVASRTCRLVNRKTGRGVQLDYAKAPYLVLWTKPQAKYLCIEPWFGLADNINSDGNIEHKEGIQSVEAGGTFMHTRVITALEG